MAISSCYRLKGSVRESLRILGFGSRSRAAALEAGAGTRYQKPEMVTSAYIAHVVDILIFILITHQLQAL